MSKGQGPRWDGPESFAPVARRIRARAEQMLADLPVEDPALVWARRASLMAEIHGSTAAELTVPTRNPAGEWRWHPSADHGVP